jgi:NAD(P)-dependent dehydrogenase (short-subunit alcohol dehydrogenase family)
VHTAGRVTRTPLAEITDEEFEASIDANPRAAFYVLREAARRLADGGRIITLTTSITAVTIPGYSIYAGHKAATEQYVRALAKELGSRRITVNAIGPGRSTPDRLPMHPGRPMDQRPDDPRQRRHDRLTTGPRPKLQTLARGVRDSSPSRLLRWLSLFERR